MVDSRIPVWTLDQGADAILSDGATPEQRTETIVLLRRHIDAGKGIAYYRNEDLGHPDVGNVIALTFGTPEAQFEPEAFPDGPPKQMPDGLAKSLTGGINWRYQLRAVTYALPDIVEHHDGDETVPTTQVWVAVDVAAEGPDGMVVVEQVLGSNSRITGWRIINPANDEDAKSFEEIRDRLKTVFEEQGPMEELPFGRVLNHLHGDGGQITAENVVGHVESHHIGMDLLDPGWRENPLIAHEADHNAHDFKGDADG